MANLFEPTLQRALDSNGNPISGAKLYVYRAGSTTPAPYYLDPDGATLGPHPLTADSAGLFAKAYLVEGALYRIKATDSTGAITIWDAPIVYGGEPRVTVAYETRAELEADLEWPAGSTAIVYGDATEANNTLYVKSGDPGSGGWSITPVGAVAENTANINTVAARDSDIGTVAARDTDIAVVSGIDAEIAALAPRASDIEALGPVASDIEVVADNISVLEDAADAAATIVAALEQTSSSVRRLTRATEPLVIDGNSVLSKEPDQIIGPWGGGTIYGLFATGDSTSVGVSGGTPSTPASTKHYMFNGGIVRPVSRTSLVFAQEATVESGMTSIASAFDTLAGSSGPTFLIATHGTSGSSISYHMPGGIGNAEFTTLVTDARDLVAAGGGRLVIPMVFFSEGTNDEAYVVGQPNEVLDYQVSEYVDKLITVAEGIQAQVQSLLGQSRPPRIALIQNSNWTYNGGQTGTPVRSVQGRIGLGHRLAFFLRPDLFCLVGAQYHITHESTNTGLHPNGAGYIRRGSDVARTLYAEMYGNDSRPLHEIGIEHEVGTDFAVINYYSPSGEIVADTTTVTDPNGAWGFEVSDSNTGTPLSVASKAISGTSVILRFNRVSESDPHFAYALTGTSNGGSGPLGARGNIRDTSTPPAWAIYTSTMVVP